MKKTVLKIAALSSVVAALLWFLNPALADDSPTDWDKAIEALDRGDWTGASGLFNKLCEDGDAESCFMMAEIGLNDGETEKVYDSFDKCLSIDPDAALVNKTLGMARFYTREWNKSIEAYTRSLENFPLAIMTRFMRGITYAIANLPDRALEDYNAISDRMWDFVPVHKFLGQQLATLGLHDRALKHFEYYVQQFPDDAEATYRMGRVYTTLGRYPESVAWYKRTLELISPDDPKISNEMFGSLVDQGKYKEAIDVLEYSLKGWPGRLCNRANLWAMLYGEGDIERSRYHALEALKINPNQITAMMHLARIDEDRGRYDEARKYYQKILEIDPRFERARRALAKLPAAAPDINNVDRGKDRPRYTKKIIYYAGAGLLIAFAVVALIVKIRT